MSYEIRQTDRQTDDGRGWNLYDVTGGAPEYVETYGKSAGEEVAKRLIRDGNECKIFK